MYSLSGDIAAAEQSYAESHALLATLREPWRSLLAQTKSAINLARTDDVEAARRGLSDALHTAWEMGALPVVLDALMGFMVLHLNSGLFAESATLAGVIATHPALSAIDTRPWLEQLIRQTQRRLSPDVYDEAFNPGTGLDLGTVVKTLLDNQPISGIS
jgi:hypothetical protein